MEELMINTVEGTFQANWLLLVSIFYVKLAARAKASDKASQKISLVETFKEKESWLDNFIRLGIIKSG